MTLFIRLYVQTGTMFSVSCCHSTGNEYYTSRSRAHCYTLYSALQMSSIHIHYVLLGTLYRSALVPPGTLHHKPPRMGGTTFFLFIFITTTIKRIPYCTIIKFKNLKKIIPYLLFQRFTLIIAPFLFMCTTKPPRIGG